MPKKRKSVSDLIESYLKMEITNRCPLCGEFETHEDPFTNHHINHNPSISEYWNLIRICQHCHDEETKQKNDKSREKRIYEIKRDLFRNFIGSASLEVLLMAYKYEITNSLPALANPLIRFGYLVQFGPKIYLGGTVEHPTLSTYQITSNGKEIVERLRLNNLPEIIPRKNSN